MVDSLTEQLHRRRLSWKPSSLKLFDSETANPTVRAPPAAISVSDSTGNRTAVPVVPGLGVLGAWLTAAGSTGPAVDFRLRQATTEFWHLKAHFLNRRRSFTTKLRDFYKRIIPIAVYNSCGWVWSAALWDRLTR